MPRSTPEREEKSSAERRSRHMIALMRWFLDHIVWFAVWWALVALGTAIVFGRDLATLAYGQ